MGDGWFDPLAPVTQASLRSPPSTRRSGRVVARPPNVRRVPHFQAQPAQGPNTPADYLNRVPNKVVASRTRAAAARPTHDPPRRPVADVARIKPADGARIIATVSVQLVPSASRGASSTSASCTYLDHRRRRRAAIRQVKQPPLKTRPFASGAAAPTRRDNSSAHRPPPPNPGPSRSTASPSARPHPTAQQLFLAAEYKRPRCCSLAFAQDDSITGRPAVARRLAKRGAPQLGPLRRQPDTHHAGGRPRAAMARPPVHRVVVANSFDDDEPTAAPLRRRTPTRPHVATKLLRWTSSSVLVASARLLNPPGAGEVDASWDRTSRDPWCESVASKREQQPSVSAASRSAGHSDQGQELDVGSGRHPVWVMTTGPCRVQSTAKTKHRSANYGW